MKFRPSIKPKQRASMTRTALAQGIMPTVGGLQKITDKLDVLNTSLDNMIDTATEAGKTIPKNAVFTKLKELRRELGGAKIDAPADFLRDVGLVELSAPITVIWLHESLDRVVQQAGQDHRLRLPGLQGVMGALQPVIR